MPQNAELHQQINIPHSDFNFFYFGCVHSGELTSLIHSTLLFLFAGHVAGCGITDEVSQWMENIQNSAVEELPEPMSKDYQKLHRKQLHKKSAPQQQQQPHPPKKYISGDEDFKYPHQKYTKEANFAEGAFYDPSTGRRLGSSANVADWHQLVHERVRRATDNGAGDRGSSGGSGRGREDNKNTCSLYIQTDPLIWRHIREGIADVSTCA